MGHRWEITTNLLVQPLHRVDRPMLWWRKCTSGSREIRVGGNTKGVPVPSLARLRKQAGMSQSALSQRAGVGRNTISRLEHGANAHYGTIDKLVEALGTTRSRLIKPPRQVMQGAKHRSGT